PAPPRSEILSAEKSSLFVSVSRLSLPSPATRYRSPRFVGVEIRTAILEPSGVAVQSETSWLPVVIICARPVFTSKRRRFDVPRSETAAITERPSADHEGAD